MNTDNRVVRARGGSRGRLEGVNGGRGEGDICDTFNNEEWFKKEYEFSGGFCIIVLFWDKILHRIKIK